eukprot:gene23995-biopygen22352
MTQGPLFSISRSVLCMFRPKRPVQAASLHGKPPLEIMTHSSLRSCQVCRWNSPHPPPQIRRHDSPGGGRGRLGGRDLANADETDAPTPPLSTPEFPRGHWRGRGAGMARAWRGLLAIFGAGVARAWRWRGTGMSCSPWSLPPHQRYPLHTSCCCTTAVHAPLSAGPTTRSPVWNGSTLCMGTSASRTLTVSSLSGDSLVTTKSQPQGHEQVSKQMRARGNSAPSAPGPHSFNLPGSENPDSGGRKFRGGAPFCHGPETPRMGGKQLCTWLPKSGNPNKAKMIFAGRAIRRWKDRMPVR